MKKSKKEKLERAGWKIGSVQEFLDLSNEEVAFIEVKVALANYLKYRRIKKNLTQDELAHTLHSSQSRVAKMESGDPTVSLDLIVRSLLSLGTSPKQLAKVISSSSITTV
jgi:DNA-binding XRE family transcriptional regulator